MHEAQIVAVGSELLAGDRDDTNSKWLAGRLIDCGVLVEGIAAVPDDASRIAGAVRSGLSSGLVVVCGGLGPTADDRTREGIARALTRPLARNAAAEAAIRRRLAVVGRTAGPDQLRQADLPAGAEPLDNPVGIAPGLLCRDGPGLVVALPGVPAEMKAMFEASVAAVVAGRASGFLSRRVLKVAGRSESFVDGEIRELLGPDSGDWTILATERGVEIVLRGRAASEPLARERLAPLEEGVRQRLGADVYGADEDSLPSVIGAALAAAARTVACAESCTAGLLAAALTEIPGSSRWFRGGLIVYSDELKETLAGVPGELLAKHGAVSEPVAVALARGARRSCGADYGVGVTGIAGPGGGTPEKPVGLVHLAVAGPERERCRTLRLLGGREGIRRRAVALALDELRRCVLDLP